MTYLQLPITLGRIRKVHLQFVFDRIKAKLVGWKGRLMNHAGRRALLHSVLCAIPIFALIAIRVLKDSTKTSTKYVDVSSGHKKMSLLVESAK